MLNHRLAALAVAASLAIGCGSIAIAETHDHGAHAGASEGDSESTRAYKAANETMHTDMAIAFTGDADIDFVRGMIPHHQGAIDMAQVVLRFGKDPDIRKLAEEIIAAQEAEIAMMRAWLEKHDR